MGDPQLRALVHALASPGERQEAVRKLAARIGVRRMLLLVKDPALDVMLPAPGMPKTQAGGPLWRAFLRRCLAEPRPSGTVDLAGEPPCKAEALVEGGCAVVLLERGGDWPAELVDAMPLLAALLGAQQEQAGVNAHAAAAREAASRAHELARALDAARAAAAELNVLLREEHRRKDEFLAMLAHELRNPLAPMVSAVEMLRHAAPGTAGTGRQLEVLGRQLQQLTHLVDDLLDVSRVSRGLIELRRETLRLADVLSDAVEVSRPLMEQRGHVLSRSGGDPHLCVSGDRVRLTQVFSNLLNNAAKYTPDGGTLLLSVVPDGGRVSVVVRDNGIGIPRDMLSRIFDMFAQVADTPDRAQGGLGIGLTLVRTLVELHGGHVTAHSVGPGHGSTFTVSLPLVAAPASVRAPEPAPAEQALRGEAAHAMRVLVVDDNKDAAESLAEVLRFMGAQATVAHDGAAALELGAQQAPDLVFLDIGLPGMDGYEIAREWRRRFGEAAHLVALTGYGSEQDRKRARQAGCNAHMVKPVTMAAMQQLLAGIAGTRAAA